MQFLKNGEVAPYTGVLLAPRDAAELVVSASVSRSLFDLELKRQKDEYLVRLGAARKLCQAEQDAHVRVAKTYQEEAQRLEAWHRSPLLWFVVGVAATSLTLLAVSSLVE